MPVGNNGRDIGQYYEPDSWKIWLVVVTYSYAPTTDNEPLHISFSH